jgi:hypothetical protein
LRKNGRGEGEKEKEKEKRGEGEIAGCGVSKKRMKLGGVRQAQGKAISK